MLEKKITSPKKKRGYMVSPNYKGKNMMTRTQWRRYQWNKKVGRDITTPYLKLVETFGQKKQIPKVLELGQGKIVANQTMAMTVDSTGKKAVVASQSVKCSSEVEKQPRDGGESKEEPEYSPQPEEGDPEYSLIPIRSLTKTCTMKPMMTSMVMTSL